MNIRAGRKPARRPVTPRVHANAGNSRGASPRVNAARVSSEIDTGRSLDRLRSMETPSEPPLTSAGPDRRLRAVDWTAIALLALTVVWAAAAYATTVASKNASIPFDAERTLIKTLWLPGGQWCGRGTGCAFPEQGASQMAGSLGAFLPSGCRLRLDDGIRNGLERSYIGSSLRSCRSVGTVVGRGGLEPPTSALTCPERCA
jgi:hypothetical protein